MHKPSLYAAFGDKDALYRKALEAYQARGAALLRDALARVTLREALTAFFNADLDLFLARGGQGCFMLETALPVARRCGTVARKVRGILDMLRDALEKRLIEAKAGSDGLERLDVPVAADLIISMHIALSARARSGEPRRALEVSVSRVVDLLCGPAK